MLEELVQKITDTIVIVTLAGAGLVPLSSGCTMYKSMSPDLIQAVTPIEGTREFIPDYSQLTWQEAIKSVQTPKQAQDYLERHFTQDEEEAKGYMLFDLFNVGIKGESFKYNHTRAKGVCLDYATSAAALLSDDGYDPLLLAMEGEYGKHVVFLYKINDGYGTVGYPSLEPWYYSVDRLVKEINQRYGFEQKYDRYVITNLDENFPRQEWISGEVDLQIPFFDKWTKLEE